MSVCVIAGQSDLVSAHINKKLLKIYQAHASGFLWERIDASPDCVCVCGGAAQLLMRLHMRQPDKSTEKTIINLSPRRLHINFTIHARDSKWK